MQARQNPDLAPGQHRGGSPPLRPATRLAAPDRDRGPRRGLRRLTDELRKKQEETKAVVLKYEAEKKATEDEMASATLEMDKMADKVARIKKEGDMRVKMLEEELKDMGKYKDEVDNMASEETIQKLGAELDDLKQSFEARLARELLGKEEEMKEKYKTWDREMNRLISNLEGELAKKDAEMEKVSASPA